MTRFLLDTNVISELRKGTRANQFVIEWFDHNNDADHWLSVVVVGELKRGAALIERRDAAQGRALRTWLDELLDRYDDRILDITPSIARRWAKLNAPDPLPVLDGYIAATALEHDLTVATRNVTDITRTGVSIVNPFEPRP